MVRDVKSVEHRNECVFVVYGITDFGIVRLSLRAQFIARRVHFQCNLFDGLVLEHESKLWLDDCLVFMTVGPGIHLNTGCKCLLTKTTILNCGNGDDEVTDGHGAIVIYGTDINYAEHLVWYFCVGFMQSMRCTVKWYIFCGDQIRKTEALRFPSMDRVPEMVMDPDPKLSLHNDSMERWRFVPFVQFVASNLSACTV